MAKRKALTGSAVKGLISVRQRRLELHTVYVIFMLSTGLLQCVNRLESETRFRVILWVKRYLCMHAAAS